MDPQKISQLDPKLRDAYQRVMGTVIPEPQAPPVQTQTPPLSPPPVPASDPTPVPPPAPQPEPIPTPVAEPTPAAIEEPVTTPVEPPQPPVTEPIPQTPPQTPPQAPPQSPTEPQPAINPQLQTIPTPQPALSQSQNSNFVQMNSEVASTAPVAGNLNFAAPTQSQTTAVKKKGGMLMPLLIGIVILVFIAVYTLFWTKIFNFKLPFLP